MGVIILLLLSGIVYGQSNMTDTTFTIKEVVVKSERLQDFAIGSRIQKLSPISLKSYTNYSFGDLLAAKSTILINSYGPGGLSSPSIRGGASAHAAVIWEGVNIQSPMNGGINLALIPAGFIHEVNIQYGGSGTLFGSGAVSGVIHLGDKNLFIQKDAINLNLSYGSFNTKSLLAGVNLGNDKVATSFKFYSNNADNDFNYELEEGRVFTQTNAGLKQYAFMNETQLSTGKSSFLKLTSWYQIYEKDVQTKLDAAAPSEANQKNQDIRLALRWKYATKNFSLNAKSVFLTEKVNFIDPSYMMEANENKSKSWINELESKYIIDAYQVVLGGLNYTYEKAESDSYVDGTDRKRVSAFISYKVKNLYDRLNWVNSIRQEMVDSDFIPLVFSSGLNFKISKPLTFIFNISRNYNNPTLNDLYWEPGPWTAGNPDLKPEYGWSGDFGLAENFKTGEVKFEFKQNFFWNNINDWIIWLPDENFIWMPENKKKGKTHGIDLYFNAKVDLGGSKLEINTLYSYTKSVFEELENGSVVKKETVYIPRNQYTFSLSYVCQNWSADLTQNYFDERLYDIEQEPLEAFSTYNLAVNYNVPLNKHKLTASLHLNNFTNRYYQMIKDYAMPGRIIKFGLNYTFGLE